MLEKNFVGFSGHDVQAHLVKMGTACWLISTSSPCWSCAGGDPDRMSEEEKSYRRYTTCDSCPGWCYNQCR